MQLIVQQGLKPAEGRQAINSAWTGETILSKSIDTERDERSGVKLSKYNLNYVFEPKDKRDKKFSAHFRVPVALPSNVDLSSNWGIIYDQGDLGSCVANSVSYGIRFVRQVEKKSPFTPSRLYIYYYGRVIEGSPADEDTGLYIRDGYKSVATYSVCSENNWPYKVEKFAIEPSKAAQDAAKQHKTFNYLRVNQNENEIKACLASGYPISLGITVFESFMSDQVARTGIVPMPNVHSEQQVGGHAVTIVGYDDSTKRFKLVNSWSDSWGDKGFFYMNYDFILDPEWCDDFWTPRLFL